MSQINKLPASDKLTGGDLFAAYIQANGDARKVAATTLLAYIQANLTTVQSFGAYTTQYASPSATSFAVLISDDADNDTNVHLVLTPTAAFADGKITLPVASGAVDKQEVLVNCTQAVTSLVVDKNEATAVTGAPTSLAADDFFRLKYDAPTSTWYRVG